MVLPCFTKMLKLPFQGYPQEGVCRQWIYLEGLPCFCLYNTQGLEDRRRVKGPDPKCLFCISNPDGQEPIKDDLVWGSGQPMNWTQADSNRPHLNWTESKGLAFLHSPSLSLLGPTEREEIIQERIFLSSFLLDICSWRIPVFFVFE